LAINIHGEETKTLEFKKRKRKRKGKPHTNKRKEKDSEFNLGVNPSRNSEVGVALNSDLADIGGFAGWGDFSVSEVENSGISKES